MHPIVTNRVSSLCCARWKGKADDEALTPSDREQLSDVVVVLRSSRMPEQVCTACLNHVHVCA